MQHPRKRCDQMDGHRCRYMQRDGWCKYGCTPRRRACHRHSKRRICRYGNKCRFAHCRPGHNAGGELLNTNTFRHDGHANRGQPARGADSLWQSGGSHGPHGVCLVSGGWNKDGAPYLTEWMPHGEWEEIWHRIDLLFDASEHLDAWGTATTAQNQFMRVYPWCIECFEWLEPYILRQTYVDDTAHVFLCKSGHHRSVAFVELLAQYLQAKHSGLRIWRWHLDHHRQHWDTRAQVWNLQAARGLDENDFEKYLEWPLVSSIQAHRSHPVQQLHDHFFAASIRPPS